MNNNSNEDCTYNVLYISKQNFSKKRKVYQEGQLSIRYVSVKGSYEIILHDNENNNLKRVHYKNIDAFKTDAEVTLENYVVNIESKITNLDDNVILDVTIQENSLVSESNHIQSAVHSQVTKRDCKPINKQFKPSLTLEGDNLETKKLESSREMEISKQFHQSYKIKEQQKVTNTGEIDLFLLKQMRAHQIEGAKFILNCLLGQPSTQSEANDSDDVYTGAILADEMGLGKTLTSIAVLYTIIQMKSCKGIIICPSSLVNNWDKEFKKWLGVKIQPLCLKAGQNPDSFINTFTIGHNTKYPVMIISYEMFRKYQDELNLVHDLKIIICDEGHRLKNVGGTKTIQALRNCRATLRLLLSGTPIQNDLNELYAIVAFVAPGYLGSLPNFKNQYSGPISKGQEENASEIVKEEADKRSSELKDILSKIMIRRTQQSVLQHILPLRTDHIVYLPLSPRQDEQYELIANDVLHLAKVVGPSILPMEANKENRRDNDGGQMILSGLLNLRMICNSLQSDIVPTVAASKKIVNHHGQQLSSDILSSTKLQFIESFLTILRKFQPNEKVVIVSNFKTTLDLLEGLLKKKNLSWYRIDGDVKSDDRQNLIDQFNSDSSRQPVQSSSTSVITSVPIFLLSSKAGGVGINLTGASRLVMMEPDWNPATDIQAMSRIWREGQLKKVHIYRLIVKQRIDEAILLRQRNKSDLAGCIVNDHDDNDGEEGEDVHESIHDTKNPFGARLDHLIYPSVPDIIAPEPSSSAVGNHGDDGILEEISKVLKFKVRTCLSI